MRLVYIILCCFLAAGSFTGCGKLDDITPPSITWSEPEPNTVIDVPDTLKIVAEVSDNSIITTILITLVDNHDKPLVPALYYYPDTKKFTVICYLPIDDKLITSGEYRLLITAFDGLNSKNEYRPVQIHELPLEMKGYIAITSAYPFKTTVTKLDTSFEPDTSFLVEEGFALSAFSNVWDQFYYVSPSPSTLWAYPTKSFEPLWEFAAEQPRPEITSLFADRQLIFSSANGDAGILNEGGNIILRTPEMPGKEMDCLAADDTYIYAELVSLSGDQRSIIAYYRVTGNIRSQKNVSNDIFAILPLDGKALMISGSGISTIISEFDADNTWITTLKTLQAMNVQSALKISEDEVLLFTDNEVLIYDYYLNSVSEYLPEGYRFGRLDKLNSQLFAVKDMKVDIYRLQDAVFIRTISFDAPVKDFQILFNK
jgi:hypothetical protein